jgi:arylsulfatase A-like enzyme
MSFVTQGKANQKILIIIFVLAAIVGGTVLVYQYWWIPKEKIKMGKELFLPKYNLLIIVSDSLRADALSCYGGEANTPNICGLAKDGVLFENTYSSASWTLPSSLSIFTGNYPYIYADLGMAVDFLKLYKNQTITLDNIDKVGEVISLFRKINDKELLLAGALGKNGYDVKYEIDNNSIDSPAPFLNCCNQLQGLEKFKEYKDLTENEINFIEENIGIKNIGSGYKSIYSVLDYLLNIKEKNFFTLTWISDPHEPYSPPEKFKKNINVEFSNLSEKPEFYELPFSQINQKLSNSTDYDMFYLKQLYLKEVESVDERVGYLLKALEYNGLKNNTFIVFTSDHGEGFGEHGVIYHGNSVYNETVQVPLIIAGPNIIKGERIKENISHVDLMPTIKDLMGVDCLYNAQGESYKSLLVGEKDFVKQRFQYVQGGTSSVALIENNYKLIINNNNATELYNLFEDPGELNNILKDNQVIVNEMRKKTSQFKIKEIIRAIKYLPSIQDKGKYISGLLKWVKEEEGGIFNLWLFSTKNYGV